MWVVLITSLIATFQRSGKLEVFNVQKTSSFSPKLLYITKTFSSFLFTQWKHLIILNWLFSLYLSYFLKPFNIVHLLQTFKCPTSFVSFISNTSCNWYHKLQHSLCITMADKGNFSTAFMFDDADMQ